MCCEGWCPLAAVSVQDTLPHRPQVFRVRDVASCDVGQLFKPPKSTQDQAPTKASAVKVGFPRRSEPARHAAAPTKCFELLLNWSLRWKVLLTKRTPVGLQLSLSFVVFPTHHSPFFPSVLFSARRPLSSPWLASPGGTQLALLLS